MSMEWGRERSHFVEDQMWETEPPKFHMDATVSVILDQVTVQGAAYNRVGSTPVPLCAGCTSSRKNQPSFIYTGVYLKHYLLEMSCVDPVLCLALTLS